MGWVEELLATSDIDSTFGELAHGDRVCSRALDYLLVLRQGMRGWGAWWS